jgi:PhnB protein
MNEANKHIRNGMGAVRRDSVVVLAAMEPPYAQATRASTYVYVADVDATYERAIAAGASSLGKPTERPFQERTASVKDAFGNTWYLATHTGKIAR